MQKNLLLLLLGACVSFSSCAQKEKTHKITLPNGWGLSPAGKGFLLGDLPLNMAVSPSEKLIAVTNNGQSRQSIQLIKVSSQKVLSDVTIGNSWLGLKFSADEKYLYAGGGNDNWIIRYAIKDDKLKAQDTLRLGKRWPTKISTGGFDIDDKQNLLYVVTKEDNSMYILDLVTKTTLGKYKLDGEGYTCLLSPDKKELFISCWGCDKLVVFNTITRTISQQIDVGDNPNDICLTKNGKYLFVANSNDNSVSVIDVQQKKVIETLSSSLQPNALPGSTTNGVALGPDDKTLYIANADNNCLVMFDVSKPGKSVSLGFIPTGWYPTSVKAIGKEIYVTNGKGFSSLANPDGPNPVYNKDADTCNCNTGKFGQYIAGLFTGTMSVINVPKAKELADFTNQVLANTPYTKIKETLTEGVAGNPVPRSFKEKSPIKYVFYVVKENRTYDQVLGDMKEGNGDPKLVLFGNNVTPNLHKIAKDFALLDNFYVDAEVSADGHEWAMGAYCTDYVEKTWPARYSDRGGSFAGEGAGGQVANNKGGYLWDYCQRGGVTFRNYGEFVVGGRPSIPVLKNNWCTSFTGWDLDIRDTTRYYQWQKDFDSLVKINALPRLNTVRFANDHTQGLLTGKPTPYAMVADNDLAVGMFLDHLSKSPVWKESVVFILEDDAQNGPDHVDAHRSPVFVAGPYVKRNFVDHTPYTTSGVLRTIELLLGLPPMSQYDAAATPLWRCYTSQPNNAVFNYLRSNINLDDINKEINILSKKSDTFNFTRADAIPDAEFNEVLWKGLKGMNAIVPSPKRAAFVTNVSAGNDDDD